MNRYDGYLMMILVIRAVTLSHGHDPGQQQQRYVYALQTIGCISSLLDIQGVHGSWENENERRSVLAYHPCPLSHTHYLAVISLFALSKMTAGQQLLDGCLICPSIYNFNLYKL